MNIPKTYFCLENDAMLKGFIRMQRNPQVKVIIIRHLAIGLPATFVERHSPFSFVFSRSIWPVTSLLVCCRVDDG